MANRLRTPVFALIAILACLVILEVSLKVSGVNKDYKIQAAEFKRNPLNFKAAMRSHRYEPKAEEALLSRLPADYLTQSFDPDLFWTIKPRSDYYPDRYSAWAGETAPGHGEIKEKINSLGFRDREIPRGKLKDEVRIFCMGNSCTFGLGVYRDETFSARLESLIDTLELDSPVSVFNAGTPGYTSYQGLALLKKKILPLKPDIVIISYGINDNARNRNIPDADFAFLLRETHLRHFQNGILAKSEIYLGLKQLIQYFQFKLRARDEEKKPRVSLEAFRENYLAMIRLIRESGGRAVIFRPALAGRGSTVYLETLRDIAARSGACYFDGKKYFDRSFPFLKEKTPDLEYNDLFIDALHPSSLGHRIIAEGLAASLLSEGVLPAPHDLKRNLEMNVRHSGLAQK